MANKSPSNKRRLIIVICFVAIAAITLAGGLIKTNIGKHYTITRVDTQAEISAKDGGLYVEEARTFDFKGHYHRTWWEPGAWGDNGFLNVFHVYVQDEGCEQTELTRVAMDSEWRSGDDAKDYPTQDCWAWDKDEKRLYVFHDAQDVKTTITTRYGVGDFIQAYDDAMVLYWKYIGDSWGVDSADTTLTLRLPTPTGVDARDYVNAWSHGPLEGTEQIDTDGTVTIKMPLVKKGQFAEVRCTFPTQWLTGDTLYLDRHSGDTLASIQAEESAWEQKAEATRTYTRIGIASGIVLFILGLASVFIYQLLLRRPKPVFQDTYWRDAPHSSVHPLVIECCEKSVEKPKVEWFASELMHLAASGVINVEPREEAWSDKHIKNKTEYWLHIDKDKLPDLNEIDRQALVYMIGADFVNGGYEKFEDPYVTYSSLVPHSVAEQKALVTRMKPWQDAVAAQVESSGLLLTKRPPVMSLLRLVGIISWIALPIACFATYFLSSDTFWIIANAITLLAAALILTIFRFSKPRTQEGAEVHAKTQALKKWLEDFTSLGERPPADVKVWGMYMTYATILGVAYVVIEQLRALYPHYADSGSFDYTNAGWAAWYTDSNGVFTGGSGGMETGFSSFGSSFSSFSPSSGGSSGGGGGGGGGAS